jgi:hypothetical protein
MGTCDSKFIWGGDAEGWWRDEYRVDGTLNRKTEKLEILRDDK